MIDPLVDEPTWTHFLKTLPAWEPAFRQALVVSPHPDDETLGCGGLISRLVAAGTSVTVVAVTDGEHAYAGEPGQGETRRHEQTAALARLGVGAEAIRRLGLPDSGLSACEEQIVAALQELAPPGTHLIAPWRGDFHPDHEACGRAAERVAAANGLALSSYLFWTYHRGRPETLAGRTLTALALTGEQRRAKLEALACHRSQLEHASGAPILPKNLRWPAELGFEVYLPAMSAPSHEG